MIPTRCIAVLGTVAALSGVATASAATKTHGTTVTTHAAKAKITAAKVKGTGTSTPVRTNGGMVAKISAFPAGGKGSGTEATCNLWSKQLQSDQNLVDDPPKSVVGLPWNSDDQEMAQNQLNADVNNAMDAGCAVID